MTTSLPPRKKANSTLDPLTLAINRVRGVALNQLANYGLWVRRNLSATNSAATAIDLNAMPELRERLELHLDRDREPTLMARASFGQSLPWLYLLDPEWTRAHLTSIFPREPDAIAFRRAAWISYVCFTRAYDDLLPLLEEEYRVGSKQRDGGRRQRRAWIRKAWRRARGSPAKLLLAWVSRIRAPG